MNKYVLIRSGSTNPLSTSAKKLLAKLFKLGFELKVDELSFQKILPQWNIPVEIVKECIYSPTILPVTICVYLTTTNHFDLICTKDFEWFLNHLEKEQIPDKLFFTLLTSRNQKLIAYLTAQRKISLLQKNPITEQLTPAI